MSKRFCRNYPILVVVICATLSATQLAFARQDLFSRQLYPVQKEKIILQEPCDPKSPPTWTRIIKASNGLKKGEQISVFTKSGVYPAVVGDPECFVGECRANYIAINIIGQVNDEIIGAVKAEVPNHLVGVPITMEDVSSDRCNVIYQRIESDGLPEVDSEKKCIAMKIKDKPILLLGGKGFRQENDWVVHKSKAISFNSEGVADNNVVEIDSDTNPLTPILAITNNGETAILWHKESGICCPSEVTVRLSRISASGNFEFGKAFTAGGQPCD